MLFGAACLNLKSHSCNKQSAPWPNTSTWRARSHKVHRLHVQPRCDLLRHRRLMFNPPHSHRLKWTWGEGSPLIHLRVWPGLHTAVNKFKANTTWGCSCSYLKDLILLPLVDLACEAAVGHSVLYDVLVRLCTGLLVELRSWMRTEERTSGWGCCYGNYSSYVKDSSPHFYSVFW